MRELNTKDIFKMSKIMKKMSLKINTDGDNKTQMQVGAELILSIFENLHLAETEVTEFLADMSEMPVEKFGELPVNEVAKAIKEFKTKIDIGSFFK
jgi:hypothetical protein